ncbi:MAG: inorganic phosphate transporter [Rikenellaceae bacterium]
MSPIFTFIVITLGVLAIFDIIVGVANDAVNFLNSAIGSKIASIKVILGVAAVGILVGVLTSSGMMEVARSGVFYPNAFSYSDIMILFLGMIVGDILLLDIFNSLGLPTSTTVSMVFGLLGAAVGVAIYKISTTVGLTMGDISVFINSGKALAIISAILLSVVLSFLFGLIFMTVSRIIFSFRYHPVFSKFGALWCGISFTGIVYFVIFKGLSKTKFIPAELKEFITSETLISLLIIWVAASFILWMLQMFKINILKITILAGTFSLALAFAGNDLVNFIGVPMAGYDSYQIAQSSLATMSVDAVNSMSMEALSNPVRANFWILLSAGVIMVLTLCLSRKAMHVTQTELSLADQNSREEKFGSSILSKNLVRAALNLNKAYMAVTPKPIQNFISKQFEQLPQAERGNASYDLIRATVNLTAASILISIATSYKLPLSTTYVVFMVAMGSSLADKAWGRDSAVYRISGVMTVVMGWFLTALVGFTMALMTSSALIWAYNSGSEIISWCVIVGIVLICLVLFIKSNFMKSSKSDSEEETNHFAIDSTGDEVMLACSAEVHKTIIAVHKIYNRTLVAVFKENRRVLKDMMNETAKLQKIASHRKYNVIDTLEKFNESNINTGHYYVQVVDYLSEVTKAVGRITNPAFQHIDNNHEGFTHEQVTDLMNINNEVEKIFDQNAKMLESSDFSQMDKLTEMIDAFYLHVSQGIKKQIRRIKKGGANGGSSRASMLYLDILNETKTIVLQSRSLIKAQMYFIEDNGAKNE